MTSFLLKKPPIAVTCLLLFEPGENSCCSAFCCYGFTLLLEVFPVGKVEKGESEKTWYFAKIKKNWGIEIEYWNE